MGERGRFARCIRVRTYSTGINIVIQMCICAPIYDGVNDHTRQCITRRYHTLYAVSRHLCDGIPKTGDPMKASCSCAGPFEITREQADVPWGGTHVRYPPCNSVRLPARPFVPTQTGYHTQFRQCNAGLRIQSVMMIQASGHVSDRRSKSWQTY